MRSSTGPPTRMVHRVCSLSGRRPRCVVRVAAFCTVGFFVVNHFAVKLTLAGAMGRVAVAPSLSAMLGRALLLPRRFAGHGRTDKVCHRAGG